MTRPLTRDFTSTGESLVYIFGHRIGSALYSAVYLLIFQGGATAAKIIVGIFSDLLHSDYRYGRYLGGLILSGLELAAAGIVAVLRMTVKLIEGFISALLR